MTGRPYLFVERDQQRQPGRIYEGKQTDVDHQIAHQVRGQLAQLLGQRHRGGTVEFACQYDPVVLSTRLTKIWSCEVPVPSVVGVKSVSRVILPSSESDVPTGSDLTLLLSIASTRAPIGPCRCG